MGRDGRSHSQVWFVSPQRFPEGTEPLRLWIQDDHGGLQEAVSVRRERLLPLLRGASRASTGNSSGSQGSVGHEVLLELICMERFLSPGRNGGCSLGTGFGAFPRPGKGGSFGRAALWAFPAQLFMSQPVALIQNGVGVSELNPWTKETKSYGDTCAPMENAGVFQGLNHSLGFTCVWLLPPLPRPQQQFPDPGSPFPPHPRAPYNVRQKSVDGDEEDAPFSPDEHKKR